MTFLLLFLILITNLNIFASEKELLLKKNSIKTELFYKNYLCSYCAYSFDDKPTIIQHIKTVHENLKFECCKKFVDDGLECDHFQVILFCFGCPFFTKSKKNMRLHLNRCVKKLVQP